MIPQDKHLKQQTGAVWLWFLLIIAAVLIVTSVWSSYAERSGCAKRGGHFERGYTCVEKKAAHP